MNTEISLPLTTDVRGMSRQGLSRTAAATEVARERYRELIEDVARRERSLEGDLPAGVETLSLHERLERPLEQWDAGEKPIRTVPATVVWESVLGDAVDPVLGRTLVGLDVAVTALDDVIDIRALEKEEKVTLSSIVAFSSLLSFANFPVEQQAAFADATTEYLTAVAQIPAVECATLSRLDATVSVAEELAIARASYAYRARDIDAFATLPALVHDVGPDADRVLKDLRTFRAHELLYEDIVDVGIDLRDENETPLVRLMRRYDDPATVCDRFESLYASFRYSTESNGAYRTDLERLENAPADVTASIEAAMAVVDD